MIDIILVTFWWIFFLMHRLWESLIDHLFLWLIISWFLFNSGWYAWFFWFINFFIDEYQLLTHYYLIFIFLWITFWMNIICYYVWAFIRKKFNKKLYDRNTSLTNYYLIYFRFVPFFWFLWNTIAWLKYDLKIKEVIIKNMIWVLWKIIFFIGMTYLYKIFFSPTFIEEDKTYYLVILFLPLIFITIVSLYYLKKNKSSIQ
jgi:hypothetical protein